MNLEPFTSIENPTLAHFRHSVPRSFPTDCTILKGVRIITYFQTHSILTNKANFWKSQMNVNIYYIKDYQIFILLAGKKNKPNSNPNKPCPACPEFIEGSAPVLSKVEGVEWANSRKAKMNVNLYVIEDYRKNDDFIVRINKPNFQNAKNECKLNFNKGLHKKRRFQSPKKQTQFPKNTK